ncbi:acetoin reductase family protein [Mycena crocata]|nr:acetoin reductase family protein [Mycena crocata]
MPFTRNAVVTGAARGIGRAIAIRLAADGCNVVVNDFPTNQDALDALVKEIGSQKATVFAGDITVEQNVKNLVGKCVTTYGSLDIMVCNAGNCWVKPLLDCTVEEMRTLMDTNFRSVYLGYQCAARQMIKQGNGGRIIGVPNMSAYSASKFAIRGITQSAGKFGAAFFFPFVAQEWGEHKITVNAYCPGLIMTPLDLVGFVSFLASEEGGYITGQSVAVDGGTVFD